MNPKIDTLRLRVLHTKCMTVYEIAEAMGASPENVADCLNQMGYTPIYERDVPEQHTYRTHETEKQVPKNNKEENTMAKGQKTPIEKVHEIGVLKNEGKTQRQIAEITGIPFSTVGKVCARLGSTETKEEPAPLADGTSSKKENVITNTIVPEIPADVNPCDENFCCEVTGDTDMEAYLADREKFFSPKRRSVPDAVKEACLRMREDELSKIDSLLDEVKYRRERVSELEKFLEVRQ